MTERGAGALQEPALAFRAAQRTGADDAHAVRIHGPQPLPEALQAAQRALLGFVVDTLFLRGGVFTLGGAETSPAWLVVLWPNTAAATAPGGSLAALARRPLLAALLGAIAAPFSYDAGARLGALALGPGRALAIIAIVWTAVLPAFFGLRARREKPAAQ